jgi:D-threo-aldose 1-dehydrogenase
VALLRRHRQGGNALTEQTAALRPFGRAGFPVTLAGYGAGPIGNLVRVIDEDQAQALLIDAWERGVRFFDTAPLYGHGLSEHRVGHALLHRPRDEFVLSTKVGRRLYPAEKGTFPTGSWVDTAPFRGEFDYSYDGVMRQVAESLHRLCTNRVDILLIHDLDVASHGAALPLRFAEALAGAYPALVELRDQGVVRAIGVGLNESEACVTALRTMDLDCLLLAGRYTLLEQAPLDDLLPLCQDRGVAVILGGVFNSGILAKGAFPGVRHNYAEASPDALARVQRLQAACARHEVPLAAAAVQFVAAHPAVANVCLGARTIEQQRTNQAAFTHPIPTEFWQELRDEGLIRDDAPTPLELARRADSSNRLLDSP